MNVDTNIISNVQTYLSTSSTFIGFLGGVVRAFSKKESLTNSIMQVVIGSIIAWVSSPFIQAHTTTETYPIVVFLIGYGGIGVVEAVHGVFVNVIKNKAEALFNLIFSKSTTVQVNNSKKVN